MVYTPEDIKRMKEFFGLDKEEAQEENSNSLHTIHSGEHGLIAGVADKSAKVKY